MNRVSSSLRVSFCKIFNPLFFNGKVPLVRRKIILSESSSDEADESRSQMISNVPNGSRSQQWKDLILTKVNILENPAVGQFLFYF